MADSTAPQAFTVEKSSLIIDVKPASAETDMNELEAAVRNIQREGLLWGASQLETVAFGMQKLQINLIIDNTVSYPDIEEAILAHEDLVQSVDMVSWNRV